MEENLKYFEGIGRRKEAVARVRIYPEKKEDKFLVNEKELNEYFKTFELKEVAKEPLQKIPLSFPLYISAKVKGGGIRGQAEALRLALARALVKFNPDFKKIMRAHGFLTCDARRVERKKFGLKKARRAPQWQKR